MHYMPAALIGTFSSSSAGASRDRAVWVARRAADRAFATAAHNVGYDPDDRQLYAGTEYDLDELWQRAEGDHGSVQGIVSAALSGTPVTAPDLAFVLAPYAAHILARHPRLGLEGEESVLRSGTVGHERALDLRRAAFARLADAFLNSRRWLILHSPDVPLVTTDLGWQYVPGEMPGEVFLPVAPNAALVIRGGGTSLALDSDDLDLPVVTWDDWMVRLRRDAMILTAPSDVYAPTRELAEQARDLWEAPSPPSSEPLDGEPANAHDFAQIASGAIVDLLQIGAAQDPSLAFARMIAVQHRWGCDCERALQMFDEEVRDQLREHSHALLRLAEESLRDPSWGGLDMGAD